MSQKPLGFAGNASIISDLRSGGHSRTEPKINALCIGAGPEQLPSITVARKFGLHVIAVDQNPQAPGLGAAQIGYAVDIAHEEPVLSLVRELRISLVIPTPLGRFLTTVGAVNDALGLRGITRQAAVHCTDKWMFRTLLGSTGIRQPRFALARGYGEIVAKWSEVGIPCVLKSRFGSGSKGVIVIEDPRELEPAIAHHLAHQAADGETLIEELILGTPAGLDGAVVDGEFTLTLMRQKQLTPLPYRVEISYEAPARFGRDTYAEVIKIIGKAAATLGLNNCLVHSDLIIPENGSPVIIEMSGRPSGLFIASKMVPASTGVDFLGQGIKLALGEKTDFRSREQRPIVLWYFPLPVGRVEAVPSADDVRAQRGVLDFACPLKPGDALDEIKTARDALKRGYILTTDDTLEAARIRAEQVSNLFKTSTESQI
jgi:biotin carboxylase